MLKFEVPVLKSLLVNENVNGELKLVEGLFVEFYWLEEVEKGKGKDYRFKYLGEESKLRKEYEELMRKYDIVYKDKRFLKYYNNGICEDGEEYKLKIGENKYFVREFYKEGKKIVKKVRNVELRYEVELEYVRLKEKKLEKVEEESEGIRCVPFYNPLARLVA